jgi:hypothetical protein
MKNRSNVADHALYDALRTAMLSSNTTAAEVSASNVITYDSNGFTISGGDSRLNANTNTYVGWQWKASGSTVSNTSGSITSTVSAGATQGFSVVTYTGNGSTGTVGHGLGVAPSMMIIKEKSTTRDWIVYHVSLGAGNRVFLNLTDASGASSANFNNTAPTSSVFSIGATTATNESAGTYVAYCFAAVAGYSAFGSYTGNGSTDGPFIYTGFRPRFVLIRRTDSGADWLIYDSSRSTYNVTINPLFPNLTSIEGSTAGTYDIDFISNGFKVRASWAGTNASGGSYIYAAFAENPLKYALAR